MTLSTIFYKIKNTLIAWFSDIRVYAGGFVLFGNSSYSIKGPDTRYVLNVLEPGDVLLRRYDHYLGSILIPGYWSHAALYVGDGYVIHMLGQGINKEDILTFLRCDDICILRCPDNNKAVTAIKNAFNCLYKDIGYDYEFNFNDEIIAKDIAFIISKQKTDGSFEESVDITSSAIQALKQFDLVG